MGYSETSSPDNYLNTPAYMNDSHVLSSMQQPSGPYSLMGSGPPPAVAPYNPQYSDPTTATIESLHRTMAVAQAASQQQDFHRGFSEQQETLATFDDSLLQNSSSMGDRAQFPSVGTFDNSHYPYDSFSSNLYSASSQSLPEHHSSPTTENAPTPFLGYSTSPSGADVHGPQPQATFPSQASSGQSQDGAPAQQNDSGASQSPEDSSSTMLPIGFKYEIAESEESSELPPASSASFKSPPPTDIASRRKKVHVKPAALIADPMMRRPSAGPRTVSQAEGFRRRSDTPLTSPMRRIVSAGGNRSIISGRVSKSGVESAQRSPINLGGFADVSSFLEHNYHNLRQPSLCRSSLSSSSLAPPTPMSPRGGEMTLAHREGPRSTASPVDGGMNFVFNAGVPGCFTTMDGDQNLSPPETPQDQISLQPLSTGWASGVEFQDKQWQFEVPDEPLYTPAQENFPLDLQMPQPSYLSNASQPVTPAFGHFNPNFSFGQESPQYKHDSPQYTVSSHSEYSFPDAQYGMGNTSPMTKHKTFQFSNTTAADFSEK